VKAVISNTRISTESAILYTCLFCVLTVNAAFVHAHETGALKMQDMKMKDQVASHENAGQEHVGHENATHRQFTRCCYKQ